MSTPNVLPIIVTVVSGAATIAFVSSTNSTPGVIPKIAYAALTTAAAGFCFCSGKAWMNTKSNPNTYLSELSREITTSLAELGKTVNRLFVACNGSTS